MKAIVQHRYGPPEALELADVPLPGLPDDGVLVHVRAASVNAADWHEVRGEPYIARPMMGGWRPKGGIVGRDAAGVVEAVGSNVMHVAAGDEVFGSAAGAWAERVAGRHFVRKPPNLTFEQAAALPVAGCTALQAVRDHAHLASGQRVLVTGAGGGVGTFAVQIACAFGAHVTASTSSAKVDLVRSIGAEHVVDYTHDDLRYPDGPFDAIIDVGANRPLSHLRSTLARDGILVLVGASTGRIVGPVMRVVAGTVRARFLRQRLVSFVARVTDADLVALGELAAAGRLVPVIDGTYTLAEVPDALRRVESRAARGKVVITLS